MKLWLHLILLGLVGCASLMLAPLERLVPFPIDPLTVRLLSVVQPALLVLLFAALGAWAAPKVGLDAPAVRAWSERRSVGPVLAQQLLPAVVGGLAIGVVLLGFWAFLQARPYAAPLLSLEFPLATKLLYGGIVEELLLRWGLMSLLAWVAWRLAGAPKAARSWQIGFGLIAAALLFAAGHLPALFVIVPLAPAELVALVLATNFTAGAVFGWLFWKRGLEAAMIAHAFAHLSSTAMLWLVR
jgi:membrane protease YdiL (CAAX protease family)